MKYNELKLGDVMLGTDRHAEDRVKNNDWVLVENDLDVAQTFLNLHSGKTVRLTNKYNGHINVERCYSVMREASLVQRANVKVEEGT